MKSIGFREQSRDPDEIEYDRDLPDDVNSSIKIS